MFIRAQGPLVAAYALLLLAGIFFLNTPALSLDKETDYSALVTLWGVFYMAGGGISLASVIARHFLKLGVALWYFEVAGIALTITANLIYAYALFKTGFFYQEYNVVALAFIVTAFTASLISRCIEALKFIRILKAAAAKLDATPGV